MAEGLLTITSAFFGAFDAGAGGAFETFVTALGGRETIVVEENVEEIWCCKGSGRLVARGMDCNRGNETVLLVRESLHIVEGWTENGMMESSQDLIVMNDLAAEATW